MNYKTNLINKLISKKATIGVIGLGYVGLPIVRTYCKNGFKVIGYDIDKNKISNLLNGSSYIEKALLNGDLKNFINNNLFDATSDFKRLSESDALIICVPTPLDKYRQPDLSYVSSTVTQISKHLRKGQIISLESTTYPGTTEENIIPLLENTEHKTGKDFFIAYSPERENPGCEDFSLPQIPKIVSGSTKECLEVAKALYGAVINNIVPVSSLKVAEMTKLLENIHRCVNISLVNEMKIICEKMDIDVFEVIDSAATKPFGFTPYYPGPGIGGHCIPVDPFYLTWKAKEFDIHSRFIELAGEMNFLVQDYVIQRLSFALNKNNLPLSNSKILILGMAYKKNVSDLRESPAIRITEKLLKHNCNIRYYDPFIKNALHLEDKIKRVDNLDNISNYDTVLILTNHDNIDYNNIQQNAKLVIDTRGIYRQNFDNVIRA